MRLQAQTYPSWANWLTSNATAQAGSCLQTLPVLWCYLLRSASWLPFQSELFFLSNFLFVRRVLPPGKEIGYLVSDVLIFLEKFLGPLKTPPLSPSLGFFVAYLSWWVQVISPISTEGGQTQGSCGLNKAPVFTLIYTDTLSLLTFVSWKHPIKMMQKGVSLPHSLYFCKNLQ